MDRERQAKWDAANLRTASTKLRPAEHQALRAACERQDVTVYDLIRQLLRAWMAADPPDDAGPR